MSVGVDGLIFAGHGMTSLRSNLFVPKVTADCFIIRNSYLKY
jgi:hypothetical protein